MTFSSDTDRPPDVLIAEDHKPFAEAINRILQNKCHVVGTVYDGESLLRTAAILNPDLVVVDISLPLLDGLEAARQLHAAMQNTKFVFLTMNHDPAIVAAALSMGAVGYVMKYAAFSELPKAISSVLNGYAYLSSAVLQE